MGYTGAHNDINEIRLFLKNSGSFTGTQNTGEFIDRNSIGLDHLGDEAKAPRFADAQIVFSGFEEREGKIYVYCESSSESSGTIKTKLVFDVEQLNKMILYIDDNSTSISSLAGLYSCELSAMTRTELMNLSTYQNGLEISMEFKPGECVSLMGGGEERNRNLESLKAKYAKFTSELTNKGFTDDGIYSALQNMDTLFNEYDKEGNYLVIPLNSQELTLDNFELLDFVARNKIDLTKTTYEEVNSRFNAEQKQISEKKQEIAEFKRKQREAAAMQTKQRNLQMKLKGIDENSGPNDEEKRKIISLCAELGENHGLNDEGNKKILDLLKGMYPRYVAFLKSSRYLKDKLLATELLRIHDLFEQNSEKIATFKQDRESKGLPCTDLDIIQHLEQESCIQEGTPLG